MEVDGNTEYMKQYSSGYPLQSTLHGYGKIGTWLSYLVHEYEDCMPVRDSNHGIWLFQISTKSFCGKAPAMLALVIPTCKSEVDELFVGLINHHFLMNHLSFLDSTQLTVLMPDAE